MVGAYIYVRATFGRFWGWIIGFMQYIILPSTVIGTISSQGPNGNNGWANAGNNYNPNNVIAGTTGIILLVICTLSIKLNGVIQVALLFWSYATAIS